MSALSILGLLPKNAITSGSIQFDGQEILNQHESLLRSIRGSKIGMVFQEPMVALNPLHTIEKQVTEPLLIHTNMTKNERKDRLEELLCLVDFKEGINRLDAYPHQLSGGQRQRIMIAMALACKPKILIADEPTTALDVTIQASIIELLKKIQETQNLSILLISHDLFVVKKLSHFIYVMKNGKIIENGEANKILTIPNHEYTKKLINSEPPILKTEFKNTKTILKVNDLTISFKRKVGLFKKEDFFAVKKASLTLRHGETLGIVGESGSGKSTLSYGILRLLQINSGIIEFEDKSIEKLNQKELRPLRKNMQIIFQDPFSSLNPRLSIKNIIAEGLLVHEKLSAKDIEMLIDEILLKVNLSPNIKNSYPHEFSGGQRQRICIARALILKPKLVILDEPTSSLDLTIQFEILNLLKKLQETENLSYILISHDLKVIRSMSHNVIVMYKGEIIESGKLDDLKTEYAKLLIKSSLY